MYSPFGGKWCSLLAISLLNKVIRSALHDSLIIVLCPENIMFAFPQDLIAACVVLGGTKKGRGGGEGGKLWDQGRDVCRVRKGEIKRMRREGKCREGERMIYSCQICVA